MLTSEDYTAVHIFLSIIMYIQINVYPDASLHTLMSTTSHIDTHMHAHTKNIPTQRTVIINRSAQDKLSA